MKLSQLRKLIREEIEAIKTGDSAGPGARVGNVTNGKVKKTIPLDLYVYDKEEFEYAKEDLKDKYDILIVDNPKTYPLSNFTVVGTLENIKDMLTAEFDSDLNDL